MPLHLGIVHLQQHVDVSPVVRLNPALECLDVLLRHRPLSIPFWPCEPPRHGFHESFPFFGRLALPPLEVPVSTSA